MPNHITNRLTIIAESPERVKEIFNHIQIDKTDDDDEVFGYGTIDFNKIIPMPKDLDDIEANSDLITLQYDLGKSFKEIMDDMRKIRSGKSFDEKRLKNFLKGCENYIRYGFTSWYDWSVHHWDTKWNAYGQPSELNTKNTIYFLTAWSCPFKVIAALSKMYPDVEIEIAWADENVGYNIGIATYKNGVKISENIPEAGSLEAKKMFFEITQRKLEDYNMNENYEYI